MIDTRALDPVETAVVLSAFPAGARIVGSRRCRDWSRRPYPLYVTVESGGEVTVVLKADRKPYRVAGEATLYPVLAALGLPVPRVLAGPSPHPDVGDLVVYSLLPGAPLPSVGSVSLNEIDRTCRLLIEAVDRMHALTAALVASPVGPSLTRTTLADDLRRRDGEARAWADHPVVASAVPALREAVAAVSTPLAFSNGDYNTWNFLHEGETLTGILDFEMAGFADPYLPFSNYVVWSFDDHGWGAGRKAGLVERYLYRHGVSRRQFAVRLGIVCLRELGTLSRDQETIPLARHVLGLLTQCGEDYRGCP
jgi:aminoglycoside phosphotransferase (APT) family kinase protein